MITNDVAYKKLNTAVSKMAEKAQALLGFFLMLKCSETDNMSVIVRIVAQDGQQPLLEYCPDRILRINDSLLGTFVYMECLRLALHHCDKRKKDPADIYKLASDLIVSEYARYVLDIDDYENERILTQLFPSVWSYSEILSRHGFDIENDLYLEKVFSILMEHPDEVRQIQKQEHNDDNEDENGQEDNSDSNSGSNTDDDDSDASSCNEVSDTGDSQSDEEDDWNGEGSGGDGMDTGKDNSTDDPDGTDDSSDSSGNREVDGSPDYQSAKDYFSNSEDTVANWNGDDNLTNDIHTEVASAERNHLFDHSHGNLRKMIKRENAPKSHLKELVRHFIGSVTVEERVECRSKRNRRFGLRYPGYKNSVRPKLLLCLDISGSMWDALDKCILFLQSVSQEIDIDICYWDTHCSTPTRKTKRDYMDDALGGGGTDPQCIIDKSIEERWSYNGIVVITDCIFEWKQPNRFRNIMIVRVGTNGEFPDWCIYKVEFKDIAKEIN